MNSNPSNGGQNETFLILLSNKKVSKDDVKINGADTPIQISFIHSQQHFLLTSDSADVFAAPAPTQHVALPTPLFYIYLSPHQYPQPPCTPSTNYALSSTPLSSTLAPNLTSPLTSLHHPILSFLRSDQWRPAANNSPHRNRIPSPAKSISWTLTPAPQTKTISHPTS